MCCDAARETAEFYSTPTDLEQQARREIAAVLGRAHFKVFSKRSMRFDISFDHAGEPFTLMARGADSWLLETQNCEKPCPPFPLVFSDRAVALINGLGWNLQGIEQHARLALESTHPEDYGFALFQVPIEDGALHLQPQQAGYCGGGPRRLLARERGHGLNAATGQLAGLLR